MNNVRIETIDVSPKMASRWLETNEYEHQRGMRGRHVRLYADEMKKGHFKLYTTVEFAYLNDHIFLMDGQHRLAAIKRSGVSLPMCVQHRYYSDLQEIASDYARTDYGKSRTWGDIIEALHEAMGIKEKLVLTKTDFNVLKSAFEKIYRGFIIDGVKSDRVTLYEKTLEWQPYARAFFDIVGNNSGDGVSKALRRKELVAMALCTIRFSDFHLSGEKSALGFWRQVMFDDGVGRYDPRKKLREILIKSRTQNAPNHPKNYTGRELLLYATRAWEAYCKGQEVKKLVRPISPSVNIYFTPFNGSMVLRQYREAFEKSDWGEEWPSA